MRRSSAPTEPAPPSRHRGTAPLGNPSVPGRPPDNTSSKPLGDVWCDFHPAQLSHRKTNQRQHRRAGYNSLIVPRASQKINYSPNGTGMSSVAFLNRSAGNQPETGCPFSVEAPHIPSPPLLSLPRPHLQSTFHGPSLH